MQLMAPPAGRGTAKNAKTAYKKARAAKHEFNDAFKLAKVEHRARMAAKGKRDPSKGFRHLVSCALKVAANAERCV